MLRPTAYKRIAMKSLRMFKDIIWGKQTDVRGNKFKRYSTKYGKRKKEGKLKYQAADSKSTRAPYVSGDFRDDFQFRTATKDGFRLGWGAFGGRVKHLAKMGRPVTTPKKPFPEPVKDMIDRQLDLEIKHALNKTHKNVDVKIGK